MPRRKKEKDWRKKPLYEMTDEEKAILAEEEKQTWKAIRWTGGMIGTYIGLVATAGLVSVFLVQWIFSSLFGEGFWNGFTQPVGFLLPLFGVPLFLTRWEFRNSQPDDS